MGTRTSGTQENPAGIAKYIGRANTMICAYRETGAHFLLQKRVNRFDLPSCPFIEAMFVPDLLFLAQELQVVLRLVRRQSRLEVPKVRGPLRGPCPRVPFAS